MGSGQAAEAFSLEDLIPSLHLRKFSHFEAKVMEVDGSDNFPFILDDF